MARSNILSSSIAVYSFFLFFGSILSLPAATGLTLSTGNNATDTSFNLGPLPSGGETTWFWVSGDDGFQIIPISGPQDTPSNNITASSGSGGVLTTSDNNNNGDAYQFAFGNAHGPTTQRPLLANYLFECALGLFDRIPASGQGARTPYPTGKYVCRGNPQQESPGLVRIQLVRNPFGWQMDFHDVALLLKVVHDQQGSRDEVPFFDFEVKYTSAVGRQEYRTVAYGEWEATGATAIAAVTSS